MSELKHIVGVILAGGYGTRLRPLTHDRNKHLLPVYDRHMILYPLETLIKHGIRDIIIVTGRDEGGRSMSGQFIDLLGSHDIDRINNLLGSNYEGEIMINYVLQEKAGGIAQALSLTRNFVGNNCCLIILGDNIIFDDLSKPISAFRSDLKVGACLFVKEMPYEDLYADFNGEKRAKYGIAIIKSDEVVDVIEKPKYPAPSNLIIPGVYLFDNTVFDKIKNLKPSWRGELEIVDLFKEYVRSKRIKSYLLKEFWLDVGDSVDGLLEGSIKVRELLRKANK